MDKPVADLTDQELLREYECIEDCDQSTPRTEALTAELQKRNLDF